MSRDFSPLETVENFFRFAWLLALLMILGALAGYLIFSLRQPVYETRIAFSFGIDYAQTGVLTDVEEDQAIEIAGDIVSSPRVMEQVLATARQNGIPLKMADLALIAVKERAASTWIVRFRHADPQTALFLADRWGEQASEALAEASRHSIVAGGLTRYLNGLESCLETSVATEPVQAFCQYQNLAEIQAKIQETSSALHQEKIASQGLLPAMGFQWAEKAVFPVSPALYGRGTLMLAGAVLGLVLAVILVGLRQPRRIFRDRQHD